MLRHRRRLAITLILAIRRTELPMLHPRRTRRSLNTFRSRSHQWAMRLHHHTAQGLMVEVVHRGSISTLKIPHQN